MASENYSMDGCVVVNVEYFDDDGTNPTILKIPYDITWPDLELLLKLNFDCPGITVKYLDEDTDLILISSQDELFEAFQHAKRSKNVLSLTVQNTGIVPERGQAVDGTPLVSFVESASNTCSLGTQATVRMEEVSCSTEPVRRPMLAEVSCSTDPVHRPMLAEVSCSTDPVHRPMLAEVSLQTDTVEDGAEQMETDLARLTVQSNPPDLLRCNSGDTEETGEQIQMGSKDKETGTIEIKRRGARPKARRGDCYSRCAKEMGDNYRSQSQPEDRRKYKRNSPRDQESGERQLSQNADSPVSYNILTEFLGKLKEDLRTEIVRDVTRKTVKQVLKGLDGAVIQTVQGSKISPEPASGDQERTPPPSTHPSYVHDGITCDNCEQTIVGVRYKCGNCQDYDLCEPCEALDNIHTPNHVFVKLRRPCIVAGKVHGFNVPLVRCEIYKTTPGHEDVDTETPDTPEDEEAPALPDELKAHPRWEKFKEKMVRMQEKLKKKEEKLMVKHKRKEEKLKRRLEQERSVPLKREKLDIPQLKRQGKYDAKFIEDVTIPDGTRVQPGTKLLKTWILRNTGNAKWSDTTKLRMMWGNMAASKTEVSVPHLPAGEQGIVSVELVAPMEAGRYQSHWKMFDSGVNFGHRVWCAVIVEAKEVLEPTCPDTLLLVSGESGEQLRDLPPAPPVGHIATEAPDSVTMGTREDVEKAGSDKVEEDLVTAATAVAKLRQEQTQPAREELVKEDNSNKDLLSFELVDAHQRSPPKVSQTATPTNTPLDMTPPKSPVAGGLYDRAMSNSSSVEMMPEVTEGEEPVSMEMMDYVQERMASLGLRPELDIELESLSSLSEDESLSDGDFFIVPLPDCFDPSKPLTRSQIQAAAAYDGPWDENYNTIPDLTDTIPDKSVDDILTASDIETPTLSPEPSETAESVSGVETDATLGETQPLIPPPTSEHIMDAVPLEASAVGAAAAECLVPTSQADSGVGGETTPGEDEIPQLTPGIEGEGSLPEGGPSVETGTASSDQPATAPGKPEQQAKAGDFANQLMSTAVNAATRAAAQAYSTAKEVFLTWQVKHQGEFEPKPTFVPPKSDWKPPADDYQPPQSTWTPPADTYTPPQSTWTPPESTWTPRADGWTPLTESSDVPAPQPELAGPMAQLMEMGFCDRARNQQLLEKYENDVQKVIQELVEILDNDWASARH